MDGLVTTRTGLDTVLDRIRGQAVIGLDTEFVSERTYRPVLCLISLAWPGGSALLDVPALGDLSLLGHALGGEAVTAVLHAGSQDLPLLDRHLSCRLARVFDTQVAAAFLGHGQIGYQRLVGEVLGVRLQGDASFTDWTRRPLTRDQVNYAREDAAHLAPLYEVLSAELALRGRLEWCWEECRRLGDRETAEPVAEDAWTGVDGARRLGPRLLAVLRELAAWREREARQSDMPVGFVLRDSALVAMARQTPQDRDGLERVRGMAAGQIRRYGDELLAAVGRGLACPREAWPRPLESPGEDPAVRLAIDMLASWVRKRAADEAITGPLLATREDIADLMRWQRGSAPRGPQPRVLAGWRRSLVGEDLLDLLEGKRALVFQAGELRLSGRRR
ncbi:MAG TPA: ribonuclease D [Bacillota bacterium]|nr:ribonuclease D [Bacillota bacterium]